MASNDDQIKDNLLFLDRKEEDLHWQQKLLHSAKQYWFKKLIGMKKIHYPNPIEPVEESKPVNKAIAGGDYRHMQDDKDKTS
jgi:hypothetical protein